MKTYPWAQTLGFFDPPAEARAGVELRVPIPWKVPVKMRHRVPLIVLVCATLLSSHPALAQFLQQGPKLVGTGAVGIAAQGYSVSISADGNTAVVGGPYDNSSAGAAWVWTRSGGVWTQQGTKPVGAGAVGNASQGRSVSLSADGSTAVVGAEYDNGAAGAAWVFTASAPVSPGTVSHVLASQRPGTTLVDLYYDLSGAGSAYFVAVTVSSDGGASFTVPATHFTGDGVTSPAEPGASRHIVWDAGAGFPGQFSTQMRVRITASEATVPAGMALIPAGSFTMGDTFSEGNITERPTHAVYDSAFYMDRHEVTKGLWDAVRSWAVNNGYTDLPAGGGKAANHPVHSVNWYDMGKWCNARSEKEGRTPAYYTSAAQTTVYRTGQVNLLNAWVKWDAGYRLPTEAEWEKAARGGASGRRFPWLDADTITHSRANYYNSSEYSYDVGSTRGYHPTYATGDEPYTSPVGSFAPNGYGLYDMAGNVWEWCWDWYESSYYSSSAGSDPRGPTSGALRLGRGGSWDDGAFYCRAAYRDDGNPASAFYSDPAYRNDDLGFRCARVAGQMADGFTAASPIFTVDTRSVLSITTQPVSQTVNAGQNASFTVTATGTAPLSYQWRKNGVNISGATSATLTLNSVGAGNSGAYSVVVSSPQGSATSANATLAVLANPTGGVPPPPPTYSSPPPKQTGKDSLILITHGWQPLGGYEAWTDNTGWVDDMAIAINQNLISRGFNNWQVSPYKWLYGATAPFPWLAQVSGYNEGEKVGQAIVNEGFTHVHLIGHSAGAALIQGALQTIKSKEPTTVVHTTFLDPYVGPGNGWRSAYGVGADWSDSYFSIDLTGSTTEGALGGAFNVDVTWLDENKTLQPVYSSSPNSNPLTIIPSSYQATSSHPWPHDFYHATVKGSLGETEGLGFPLSKEGGGWENRGIYRRGLEPQRLGSIPVPVLSQGLFPVRSDPSLTLNTLLSANSGNGTVQLTEKSLSFLTLPELAPRSPGKSAPPAKFGTPAWLSIGVPVTDKVNFVSFDAQFTSAAGAAGLLTVYWNTNQIGMVDESVTLAGLRSYTFALPAVFEAGHYALGFSLDPFTNVVSSVTVTNISTGYTGLTNPIALSATNSVGNATPVFTLTADAGFNYLIQASTNLIDWTPFAVLLNTNGVVQFVDPAITNLSRRFYRALSP
ncbi:MAG: SUMF1/EgtB/PvdO family nonheme iron enzyme [Verrucomicrobia bacterium]|nr:SUMF1/EgtB/PvdO family nonheme iron enzyme [Verrucomicrobiota bacterium]